MVVGRDAGYHLDRELVLLDCAQVVVGHVEGAVAVDEQNDLIRVGNLRADGCGQAKAHGAYAPREK